MERKLPEPLTDLLEYLEGIGYGGLYLDAPPMERGVARVRAAPPRPAAAHAAATATASRKPSRPSAPASSDQAPVVTEPRGPLRSGPPPQDIGGRVQELAEIARQAADCQSCGLCRGRRSVVFGQGHPNADLMLVGEGPGAEEDRQGQPFVGPAGALLNKIIQAIGETRQGIYIANVVKCRPPNNRDPLPDEVAACRDYLEAQIDLVQPKVLVALGRVAAQALLGSTLALGNLRGQWHEVRGVPTRATYHPAALLRNAGWKRPTWEDMQLVRDRLRDLRGQ